MSVDSVHLNFQFRLIQFTSNNHYYGKQIGTSLTPGQDLKYDMFPLTNCHVPSETV